eukprot:TRINITY_DN13368_c0_g1_i3.p1 TRINITY_DN13368_c0_g1~~TRINITY_DN13368_c0_g1_i3.p1  ORF type:complete len:528 (+),score=76.76 TRINITY_DN13368_c0_g1_i3:56-1639(+)
MGKRIVRRRKVTRKRNVMDLEADVVSDDDAVVVDNEPEEMDEDNNIEQDGDEEEDDALVAERLRLEAMKMGGREWKELASLLKIGKEVKIPVARGAATCAILTEDGQWLWYGDKNGNVFRMNLPEKTEWVQMSRHKGQVLTMTVTNIPKHTVGVHARGDRSTMQTAEAKFPHLIATGASDGTIKVFNADDGTEIHELKGHRGAITGLSFRISKNILISGSADRTVKVWAAEDGVPLDTFYGHTGKITSVAAGWRDEALTTGDDFTTRLFKFEKGTTSSFAESNGVVECSAFVGDSRYLVGGSEGCLNLMDLNKRRPLCRVREAHGTGWSGDGDGLQQTMSHDEIQENVGSSLPTPSRPNWVTAVGTVPYSDLAASGGFGDVLKFWRIGSKDADFIPSEESGCNDVHKLKTYPIRGIPSSIFFPRCGTHCVVTVSREPRLGRWYTDSKASNHILVLPLSFTSGNDDDDEDENSLVRNAASEDDAEDGEGEKKKPVATKPRDEKLARGRVRRQPIKKRRIVRKKKQLVL